MVSETTQLIDLSDVLIVKNIIKEIEDDKWFVEWETNNTIEQIKKL